MRTARSAVAAQTSGHRLSAQAGRPREARLGPLALAALGVVFGDIGTSPLYAFKQTFTTGRGFSPSPEHVLGILSLITWALIVVVCVKYATIVLRLDNEGEGGTLALLAQLRPTSRIGIPAALTGFAYLLLFAAGMVLGDGVITPAISVLSAVEGLNVATTAAEPFVVPATVAILAGLFLVQPRGTGSIGRVFGPVMVLWFAAMAAGGCAALLRELRVLAALNPLYALRFVAHNGWGALLVLGAIVLCVTGVEAMFADLAHFGRRAIRLAWYAGVFPALLLNYYGQGALALTAPASALHNPFFALYPGWALYPMVALATAATVIASQALISGAFSLTQQAVQLGYLPRLTVVHTSHAREGQIFVPFVNVLLAVACIALVALFRSSDRLGAAYGLAVTCTMLVDSVTIGSVIRRRSGRLPAPLVPLIALFIAVDSAFLLGNLPKLAEGGYIPVAIAAAVFVVFTTWVSGRRRLALALSEMATPIDEFVRAVGYAPASKDEGTAIFLTPHPEGIPFILRHHWVRTRILRENIVLLTIVTERRPHVPMEERLDIERIVPRLTRITAHYGFMQTPDVAEIRDASRALLPPELDLGDADYLLARPRIVPGPPGRRFAPWRRRLLAYMMRNAKPLTDTLGIPPDRIIEFSVPLHV